MTVTLHEAALTRRAAEEAREILVQGETREEPIVTPAGKFRTEWIAMGPEASAWYDVERPHLLVQCRTAKSLWTLTARK